MNVGDWLRNIGLGQYEAAFRENEIESEVPPNLTAEDLKELGVAILAVICWLRLWNFPVRPPRLPHSQCRRHLAGTIRGGRQHRHPLRQEVLNAKLPIAPR